MRQAIAIIQNRFLHERNNAKTKTDEEFAQLIITGIGLIGEIALDIKRIADQAGVPEA
jgi:hypothetical protein